MRSVRELIALSADYLQKKGVDKGRKDAEELLAALLGKKRLELYFDYDELIEEEKVSLFRNWVMRRGKREPLAYILGEVEFLGLSLHVTPQVLIPRQESEIFAAFILKELPKKPCVIWDLCCGSGCLGLALKRGRPDCTLTLSDLMEGALSVAKENGRRNQLDLEFLQGDLLEPFIGQRSDVIVCNPPYVSSDEYERLETEVRCYEPREALVGGVDFYRRLERELPAFLNHDAKLFFEIGKDQKAELFQIFDAPYWKNQQCKEDWAGHDRFFFLEYEENSR